MMFFDTSVLVAASDEDHEHYAASHRRLLEAKTSTAACGAHTLAELYAVISVMPGAMRLRPQHAVMVISSILERLKAVALTPEEYMAAIVAASDNGIRGGTIYDALLLACARKVKAKTIYTWNVRHFRAAAPDLADRIQEP